MARGYPGAFGRRVNALYVWLPLCLLFLAPFIPWRPDGRRLVAAAPRPAGAARVLGLARVLQPREPRHVGPARVSVHALPAGRGCWRSPPAADGRATPLRLAVPPPGSTVAIIFLVGFRIGLNVTNSNVIDVGYAGVIGAHKLVQRPATCTGSWPSDNQYGDTYGPVNYYAYVPAYAIFGWSGTWDDLPAAHAAAILFDLLTLLGLYFLGRRVRGPTLGSVLAYAWAAYPFTLFVLSSNSNDSLVRAADRRRPAGDHERSGARGDRRAGGADEVRAARARAAAAARASGTGCRGRGGSRLRRARTRRRSWS